MPNKLILTLVSGVFAFTALGQPSKSLSEQLWDRVQGCYSMFEDMDGDGKIDYYELIDDSKNGYLSVAGDFPTCGCSCFNTVGAYKSSDGSYVFLEKETWRCSWEHGISSNRKLSSVLPEGLIGAFIPDGNHDDEDTVKNAMFYLDVEIPRYGTDTKLTVKLIPFGLRIENNSVLTYRHSEDLSNGSRPLYQIQDFSSKLQNEEVLDLILNGQFEDIPAADAGMVSDLIGDDWDRFKSRGELSEALRELKQVYDMYCLIEHETVTLGWDREKARFFVKEKGNRPRALTFREFLKAAKYWGPVC